MAAVLNDFRGEVPLTWEVDGKSRSDTLKLTLDAIRRMEVAGSTSWQDLIARSFLGTMRLDDYAVVLWAGLLGGNGGEEVFSLERCAELVLEEGQMVVNKRVQALMLYQSVGSKRVGDFREAEDAEPSAEASTGTA